MDERSRDPLAELEAIKRATEDLEPAGELADAVLAGVDPTIEALSRAAKPTEGLTPSSDFTEAVMRAVGGARKAEPGLSEGVVRWARVALLSAAAAAAVSLVLSSHAERVFDSAILEAVATVEVDE
jgi:hypothetical protein